MTTPHHTYFTVWLSLAIYLVANGVGVTHATEFSDKAHDHHGQPCAIQHVMEMSGHALAPDQVADIMGPHDCTALVMAADYIAVAPHASGHLSRAPPIMPQF